MRTSFPQEPADETRAILDRLEREWPLEVERLKEERNKLISEGWLFETRFYLYFPTPENAARGRDLLSENGYDVHGPLGASRSLIVRVYLPLDDDAFADAQQEIDGVVAPCGGSVETSRIELSRRRRPGV
jgi:hypothetical protein